MATPKKKSANEVTVSVRLAPAVIAFYREVAKRADVSLDRAMAVVLAITVLRREAP